MNLSCLEKIKPLKESGELQGVYEMIEYWTILQKASTMGPSVCTFVDLSWTIALWELQSSINSLFGLAEKFSFDQIEAACDRMLFYAEESVELVYTVLEQNLDLLPLDHTTDIYGQKNLD